LLQDGRIDGRDGGAHPRYRVKVQISKKRDTRRTTTNVREGGEGGEGSEGAERSEGGERGEGGEGRTKINFW